MELVICLLFVLYLLPFAVATRREHERLGWILAANLLIGWTGIGWLVVMHWARHPAEPAPEPGVLRRRKHLRLLAPPVGACDELPQRAERELAPDPAPAHGQTR